MRVKILDKVYSSDETPVMITFEPHEKELVASMAPDSFRFCVYPGDTDPADVEAWMKEDSP